MEDSHFSIYSKLLCLAHFSIVSQGFRHKTFQTLAYVMLFKALSAAVYGIDAYLVEVEVDVSAGLGNFLTVGLPDAAVKESKERIKAAIKNCGLLQLALCRVRGHPAESAMQGSRLSSRSAPGWH